MTREDAKSCVGKGWAGLIDQLYDLPLSEGCYLDIKEKWGELRVDVIGGCPIKLLDQIEAIEQRSASICELCGKPGKPIENEAGWIKTLCDECFHLG